jgi:hypothetical protein
MKKNKENTLPEISKTHYMIFEGECSPHREHQNAKVQQH